MVYAQLLYAGFRRQRRVSLLITRAVTKDVDALCLISNMSAEPVYLLYIIAVLETDRYTITMNITDRERIGNTSPTAAGDAGPNPGTEPDSDEGPETVPPSNPSPDSGSGSRTDSSSSSATTAGRAVELTFQGPLESGGFMSLGRFGHIVDRLLQHASSTGQLQATPQKLTLKILAGYGPEDRPVGALRSFEIGKANILVPCTWNTQRLASWRARRQLLADLRRFRAREASVDTPGVQITPFERES